MKNSKFSNDSYWESFENEMIKLMDNCKCSSTESIIEYLKSRVSYDRWVLFCWLRLNCSFSNEELCRPPSYRLCNKYTLPLTIFFKNKKIKYHG